tara:strand:- start:4960 stop:5253 length:294 start_codon:yes stop_codon:yes gene_type:complete
MRNLAERRKREHEEKMHIVDYLEMIDQEIYDEDLNIEDPDDRSILSWYCKRVGQNIFNRYYYTRNDTTPYLNLWKWWAEQHNLSTNNFDEWWDFKFL